jgi:hypothetical protein
MRPRGRWRRGDGTGHLAGGLVGIGGWLFADLLLALGLVFLVSMGVFTLPQQPPPPTSSPTASPSPSPSPTPGICTKSISDTPRMARYDPAPSHVRPTNAQLVQAFAATAGEEAGLVQTKVTDTDIDSAYQEAQWVNAQLRSGLLPGVITANTHFDDLGWVDRSGDRWLIELTIYPYITRCQPL